MYICMQPNLKVLKFFRFPNPPFYPLALFPPSYSFSYSHSYLLGLIKQTDSGVIGDMRDILGKYTSSLPHTQFFFLGQSIFEKCVYKINRMYDSTHKNYKLKFVYFLLVKSWRFVLIGCVFACVCVCVCVCMQV